MKLFKLSQDVNDGYDTFDSVIVAAENEDDARNIHPQDNMFSDLPHWDDNYPVWCERPDQVTVEYIGEARPDLPKGIILGSFNAG